MDFAFSETQKIMRDRVIQFARKKLNNDLTKNDNEALFPWDNWKKCADMGVMNIVIPENYGGQGVDLVSTTNVIEALGYACKDGGLVYAIVSNLLCALHIVTFGSELQREQYLPAMCKGKMIFAQAITEADAGSDAFAMKTRAEKCDDCYIINGTKMFVSNGPIADTIIVFAVTDAAKKHFGRISCLIVEKESQGLERGRPIEKLGLRTLQNGELVFIECRVPLNHLLGKEGHGMGMLDEMLQIERIFFFAFHMGVLERILETCIKYAKERHQFEKPISEFQLVADKIAAMKMNIELGKLILYKAAWLKDNNKRANLETSIAKLFISENLKQACLDAIQIHGAYGYMKEFEIERDLRDSIASTIYSGTSEIQKLIIAALAGV